MSDKNIKKLEKLSHLKTDSEVVLLDSIDEVEDKVEQMSEVQTQIVSELATIRESIQAIEIPIPKDYADVLAELKSKVEEDQEIVVTLNII